MARIGIVIYSLAGGGAERVSMNLAQEWVADGHSVDFVLASGEGELMDEIPAAAGTHIAQTVGFRGWKAAIRDYVKVEAPDVLLAMMEGAGVLSIQAAKGRVPVYVVSHNHFSRHCHGAARWKERRLMPLAARWYLKKAAGVIGVSEGVSEDIRKTAGLEPEKVHTLYNPILTDAFYRLAEEPVNHPWFAHDRDWLTVVTVGRLTEQKDYGTLLRAIARMNAQRHVRLLLLGQGEQLSELQALADTLDIASVLDFSGYDPNPYRYMAKADVFALSSKWEGLPTVLIEALACGTAVVSTDCPSGPSEILDRGLYGELVPVGDSEALASAIMHAPKRETNLDGLDGHLGQFEVTRVAKRYLDVMNLKVN